MCILKRVASYPLTAKTSVRTEKVTARLTIAWKMIFFLSLQDWYDFIENNWEVTSYDGCLSHLLQPQVLPCATAAGWPHLDMRHSDGEN